MDLLEQSGYSAEEQQGIYLIKDGLNSELEKGITSNAVIQNNIDNSKSILDGNDPYNLTSSPIENSSRQKRDAWDTISKCLEEAVEGATKLVTVKGIVDLLKAGKFAAAATKLLQSTAGKFATVAAASAFLLTCGATEVS